LYVTECKRALTHHCDLRSIPHHINRNPEFTVKLHRRFQSDLICSELLHSMGEITMAEAERSDDYDEEGAEILEEEGSSLLGTLITGVAVAFIKPDLLPGMAVGVAAALGPKLLPAVGSLLRPAIKTAVRAGYTTAVATRGVVAEAGEQVQDMIAEARADTAVGRKPASKVRRTARKPKKRQAAAA
jgi:hypothetical protein